MCIRDRHKNVTFDVSEVRLFLANLPDEDAKQLLALIKEKVKPQKLAGKILAIATATRSGIFKREKSKLPNKKQPNPSPWVELGLDTTFFRYENQAGQHAVPQFHSRDRTPTSFGVTMAPKALVATWLKDPATVPQAVLVPQLLMHQVHEVFPEVTDYSDVKNFIVIDSHLPQPRSNKNAILIQLGCSTHIAFHRPAPNLTTPLVPQAELLVQVSRAMYEASVWANIVHKPRVVLVHCIRTVFKDLPPSAIRFLSLSLIHI